MIQRIIVSDTIHHAPAFRGRIGEEVAGYQRTLNRSVRPVGQVSPTVVKIRIVGRNRVSTIFSGHMPLGFP